MWTHSPLAGVDAVRLASVLLGERAHTSRNDAEASVVVGLDEIPDGFRGGIDGSLGQPVAIPDHQSVSVEVVMELEEVTATAQRRQ